MITTRPRPCPAPAPARSQPGLLVRGHGALVDRLGELRPTSWRPAMPWPLPTLTGSLVVVLVGGLWGGLIGFAIGGIVGAAWFIIGAAFGAPVGFAIGVVVSVPASLVLVGVLLVSGRPPLDLDTTRRRVATVLAVLVELLVALVIGVPAVGLVVSGDGEALPVVIAAVVPTLLLAWLIVVLLRFACRHLVGTWARAWGWRGR